MNQASLLIPKYQSWQRDTIVLSLLWLATVGFYYASLKGGDLEFIKDNLGTLGRYILVAVVSFFTFNLLFFRWFASSAYSPNFGGLFMKLFQLFITIGTVTGLYMLDTGENFEHHGAYNIIIFLILFAPAMIITLLVMSFYKWLTKDNRKKCRRISLFGFIAFAIWMIISLVIYHQKWVKGLNDTRMENKHGVCEIRGMNLPWIDLLPEGTFNFWTGSQTCPAGYRSYTAKIEDNRVFVSGCRETPKVTFFPSTKEIPFEQKVLGPFQATVKDNWVTTEVTAKGTKIPPGIEAMFIECGNDERQILFHPILPETRTINEITGTADRKMSNQTDLSEKKPNIWVFYIDALSRRHFLRRMHKTRAWFEKQHAGTDWDVIQYFRYHGVGFNTDQNSRALYCGGNEDTPNFFENAKKNPVCPIWRPMKQQFDYSTVLITNFCEDWPAAFLKFTQSENADHEMLAPFCHPDYFSLEGNAYGNFKGPYSIMKRCLMGEYVHRHSLHYMEKILRTYKDSPKPFYMHSIFTEAHEGTGEVISTMDEDIANFITKMESENLLDDTIIVFISDHGLHMGLNFAFMENGMIEHRLPQLNILIPQKFNKEARDNYVPMNRSL